LTNAIQQNRYDQLLRRVGGIIGPGSKVSEVLSELFPMIDVENVPSELLILAGTRICEGGTSLGAAAGEAPAFQIFNPVDSGTIVTVTRLLYSVDITSTCTWGRSAAVFAGSRQGSEEFTDTRNALAELPIAEVRPRTSATLPNNSNQARVLANNLLLIENKNDIVVLSPGFGFEIGSATLNVTARLAINWRERVAETSELNL